MGAKMRKKAARRSAWWLTAGPWAILSIAIAGTACELFVTDPPLPRGAVAMAAPPQYGLWWQLTERCSGLSGDLAAISWYTIPRADSFVDPPLREWVQGDWERARNRIVLAGHSRNDGWLVRHEMLHALVRGGNHPAEYFQRRCNGVVACEGQCLRDGGPQPAVDSSGPIVRPDDLVVWARVDPSAPSLARDSDYVALTVSIQNPHPFAVRARMRPVQAGGEFAATFGVVTEYCDTPPRAAGDDYYYMRDTLLVLGPGEFRRWVFDLQTFGSCALYRPFFNDDTLPAIRVEPVP